MVVDEPVCSDARSKCLCSDASCSRPRAFSGAVLSPRSSCRGPGRHLSGLFQTASDVTMAVLQAAVFVQPPSLVLGDGLGGFDLFVQQTVIGRGRDAGMMPVGTGNSG